MTHIPAVATAVTSKNNQLKPTTAPVSTIWLAPSIVQPSPPTFLRIHQVSFQDINKSFLELKQNVKILPILHRNCLQKHSMITIKLEGVLHSEVQFIRVYACQEYRQVYLKYF